MTQRSENRLKNFNIDQISQEEELIKEKGRKNLRFSI